MDKILLPLERISVKTTYALTLNIGKDYTGRCILSQWKLYQEVFENFEQFSDIDLRPEISKDGILHYHGYIQFHNYKDIVYFIMYINKKTFRPRIKLDTIHGWKWYVYVRKQRHIMKPLINNLMKHGIIYHIKKDIIGLKDIIDKEKQDIIKYLKNRYPTLK